MLAAGAHAGLLQAFAQRAGQGDDHRRVAVKGAVADDPRRTVVEVEHRREGVIDTAGAQLGRQHETDGAGGGQCGLRIAVVQLAERTHRRQPGETVAKALHPAPFVIDGDEQARLAQRVDFSGECGQLRATGKIAREQDDAADQRMAQALAVDIGQCGAGDVDHQRTVGQMAHRCSRMT